MAALENAPSRRTAATPFTYGAADRLSLGALLAGLVAIGFANGIAEKAAAAIARHGLPTAILTTFDVSVILWGAGVAAMVKLNRTLSSRPVGLGDLATAGVAALLFLAPVPALGWVGLALLGARLFVISPPASAERRAATLILLLTIPLLWARIVFVVFSDTILQIDATLVAWLIGSASDGNVVTFADGSGSMFVGPSCSSLTNLSLAMLCVAASVAYLDLDWTPRRIAWAVAACASVIAINVTRMGLIGLFPESYEVIHGVVGATVAGWVTVAAIVATTVRAVARDAL